MAVKEEPHDMGWGGQSQEQEKDQEVEQEQEQEQEVSRWGIIISSIVSISFHAVRGVAFHVISLFWS